MKELLFVRAHVESWVVNDVLNPEHPALQVGPGIAKEPKWIPAVWF